MNREKIGQLIYHLRKEKGLTQKQLATQLHLSDRTISKWERGIGSPDIALLSKLAALFSINIENLLIGELSQNDFVGGNMRKSKFYVCPSCLNVGLATTDFQVSCCGRTIESLQAKKVEVAEQLTIEEIDGQWSISSNHPMTKDHYISFVAFVTGDQVHLVKQFPEWALRVNFPKKKHGQIIWFDTQKGLYYQLT